MSRFMKSSGGVGEGMGQRLMRAFQTDEYKNTFAKVTFAAANAVRAGGGPPYLRQVGGWTPLIEGLITEELGSPEAEANSIGVPTNHAWWVKAALMARVGQIRTDAQALL
jgi:hypothetical protein